MMKVYVSGSSSPVENMRVSAAFRMVQQHPNMELVHDWKAVIEAHGSANVGLTLDVRRKASTVALQRVLEADVLWLLAPESRTGGAWYETAFLDGYLAAQALYARAQGMAKLPLIIASGFTEQSIFLSRAEEFRSDMDAFAWLSVKADAGERRWPYAMPIVR